MTSKLLDIFTKYKTDKYANNYNKCYEKYLTDKENEAINLLEIGVLYGHSLLSWNEFFTNSKCKFYGVDIFHPERFTAYKPRYYVPMTIIDKWANDIKNKTLTLDEKRDYFYNKMKKH